MTPPLTTIRQPIYGIGEIAAELLLKNLQNPTEKLENRLLDISLINRSSTKVLTTSKGVSYSEHVKHMFLFSKTVYLKSVTVLNKGT